MARRKQILTLSDQLRALILQSGKSQYRICKETGIDPSHLHRFMSDDSQLTNRMLDKLGTYLQLKIISEQEQ